MKRNHVACFGLLLAFSVVTRTTGFAFHNVDTADILGQWNGRIEYAERLEAINLIFARVADNLSGTMTLVFDKENVPLEDCSLKDSDICFAIKYDRGRIVFTGAMLGDTLRGTITVTTPRVGSVDGMFELAKGKLVEKDTLFLHRLREYAEYKNEPVVSKYVFSYMDSTDVNLHRLKNKYNLDSLAGTGDELSRIVNLMKWVHTVVPYDGHSGYIKPANSLYLLEWGKATTRGLSCFMKSIVLNDVYLAMGYPSRVVHCLPKGDNFIEDHYVNIVYSKKLDKWIFMDSAVGGYLEDEHANLLSIQGVKRRLIDEQKVVLNDDAELPEFVYLHYLSKNLFRFECSFASEFNFESEGEKVYCDLNPMSYADSSSKKAGRIVVSNPQYFWANPY